MENQLEHEMETRVAQGLGFRAWCMAWFGAESGLCSVFGAIVVLRVQAVELSRPKSNHGSLALGRVASRTLGLG